MQRHGPPEVDGICIKLLTQLRPSLLAATQVVLAEIRHNLHLLRDSGVARLRTEFSRSHKDDLRARDAVAPLTRGKMHWDFAVIHFRGRCGGLA